MALSVNVCQLKQLVISYLMTCMEDLRVLVHVTCQLSFLAFELLCVLDGKAEAAV